MCRVGDIIVVDRYISHGQIQSHHSFVVIKDDGGEIQGIPFDLVALVMSSYGKDPSKREEVKHRKLSYPGNFPIVSDDVDVPHGNTKEGYIKAEQFYFFKKDTITFQVIGKIDEEIYDLLKEFVAELAQEGIEIVPVIDNL